MRALKKEHLLKEILQKELLEAQKKNPRYSLRALAKNKQISPATLSRILSGKSNLSQKMAEAIVGKLKTDTETRKKLLEADHDPYVKLNNPKVIKAIVENWYYSPIICLTETREFRNDPEWIARRLKITPVQVRTALHNLIGSGLLKKNERGRLVATDLAISTSGLSFPRVDKNLVNKTELVRKFLYERTPAMKEKSDISSIIVSTNPKKMAEAKERLKRFRRSLAKFLDAGDKSEVYLIFLQLIPLTHDV